MLTMFVWPEISNGGRVFKRDSEGYCDALSKLINRRAVEVSEYPGQQLSILFSNGEKLSMSLREEDRMQVEAGTFSGLRNGLLVAWN